MRWAKWWYCAIGLASLLNGLWMLGDPASWYVRIPAGVPDTGPLNDHFVHDIGVVFVLIGVGGLWVFRNLADAPHQARIIHWGITGFYVGHALVHVAEISLGILPADHWWIDAPLTFAPALVLLYLSLPSVWAGQAGLQQGV